ncbi:response regulator RpfG family c-di-GMP phosphodiesterase [Bradyrhizobium sp. LM3.4]
MNASAKTAAKRRLLLASDRSDESTELASILKAVGDVATVTTQELPEQPSRELSGLVVDINLRSPESVQRVRNKLRGDAYRAMPRLFVLADALHHGTMQAWALGATDTISRPLQPEAILQRIRAAFPDTAVYDASDRGKTLNRGVEAAHAILKKMFEKLPLGVPLTFDDVIAAESKILKAIKHSSLREWLTTVGCHHVGSYRHCLFVTGFAVSFAQHLGMREDDQRRLTRAALLHDVGKAFVPSALLDKSPASSPTRRWPKSASIRAAAMTRSQPRAASRRRCSTSCCTTTNFSTALAIPTGFRATRSATSCGSRRSSTSTPHSWRSAPTACPSPIRARLR